MEVTVKLFADLREGRFEAETAQVPDQCKVKDVIQNFKIPAEEVKVCLVNGRNTEIDAPLKNGDMIALFPPVGGG